MNNEFQRRIQKYGWDKATPYYEASWKDQLKPAQDKLLEMADLQPGEKVLETACGTGLVTFRAAEQIDPDGKIIGTDLSDKMIAQATEHRNKNGNMNIEFMMMDAEKLMFGEDQFDTILSALGLLYLPDPLAALKETFRVLKYGGKSVTAVWGERENCGWSGIFPVVAARVKSDVCPMFFDLGTKNKLELYYKAAGFKKIELTRIKTTLHYTTESEAIRAAFAGGPVALAYSKFNDRVKDEAHSDYLQRINKYKTGNGFNIPGEFVIVKGYKLN